MASEIPSFRTCPICKSAKLATDVACDAVLDGKKVKICSKCKERADNLARVSRQLLLE